MNVRENLAEAVPNRKPFAYFFGERKRLFGTFYPSEAAAVDRAVLVCPPFGQELIRSYTTVVEMCRHFSSSGIPAFRFDFRGCGNSCGFLADCSLDQWLLDFKEAAAELRRISRAEKILVVGFRLGASIAFLAASEIVFISAAGLWQPVISGKAFISELKEEQNQFCLDTAIANRGRPGSTEVMGFSMPLRLERDLLRLDLAAATCPFPNMMLIGRNLGALSQIASRTGVEMLEEPDSGFLRKTRETADKGFPLHSVASLAEWLARV